MERRASRLTDRQALILELVAAGRESKEIAFELGISEQAVKEHVSRLLELLAAPNRAALGDAAATMRFVGTFELDPDWLPFLFQQAPMQAAVVKGPDHRFVAVNDAYRRACGDIDLEGREYRDVFPKHSDSLALLDRVYTSGEGLTAEIAQRFTRAADGPEEDRYAAIVLQPLPGRDGKTGGVAIFSIDTTDSVVAWRRVQELEPGA